MRGRNNNNIGGGNRKGPNPLTRSYESNGPDVKIRGTAQHIGEKYLQLARDAQTSGDPVAAESYLQHAEHYFRIIAAAQQAQYQAQTGVRPGDPEADDGEDDEDPIVNDRFASPSERIQPQPPVPPPLPQVSGDRVNGQDRSERQDRPEGQERPYRQDRFGADRDRGTQGRPAQPAYERPQEPGAQDRPYRNDRGDRNGNRPRFGRDGQEGRDNRDGRDTRDMQFREQPRLPPVVPEPRPQPVVPEAEAGPDLPAFITAPVRTTPLAPEAFQEPDLPAVTSIPEGAGDDIVLRPRRRRRARIVTPSDLDAPRDMPDLAPED